MKLHFVKVNPVENMTIFVMDPLPREKHFVIANRLMDYNNLHAEQVGFIETTNNGELTDSYIRLQMMGGEFCGNATRSLAAFMVHNEYPTGVMKKDDHYEVELYTSGMGNETVRCIVKPTKEKHRYYSGLQMPLPKDISDQNFEYNNDTIESTRVDFPGITHFIVDSNHIDDENDFYKFVKDEMNKEDYDAFGIMYYDYEKKFLNPLVYVRSTDSTFWERSCGSGTSALGAALAHNSKEDISAKVKQPGGTLEVSAKYDNGVTKVYLNGLTEIVAEGIVNLEI